MNRITKLWPLVLMLGAAVTFGQSSNYTIRTVVDPPDMKDKLNVDFGGTHSRLALIEAGTISATLTVPNLTVTNNAIVGGGSLIVSNVANAGSAVVTFKADAAGDASDTVTLTVADAGAVTLATAASLTVTTDGTGDGEVTLPAGAIGSAEILDATIVSADTDTTKLFTFGAVTTTGDVTISEGKLADSTIVSADVKVDTLTADDLAADSVLASELADDSVAKANLIAGDFGDFTAGADGTCELDSGVVTTTELLDGTIAAADMNLTATFTLANVVVTNDMTVTGGDVTGANGNYIDIGEAVDGTITLGRDDSGTVTLKAVDDAGDCALTVIATGSGTLTLGSSADGPTAAEGSTVTITSGNGAITLTSSSGTVAVNGSVVATNVLRSSKAIGTVRNGTATYNGDGLVYHQVTIAVNAGVLITDQTAASWGSTNLYTFPQGIIHVLGLTFTGSISTNGTVGIAENAAVDFGFGTTATADADIAGTDEDWITEQDLTLAGAGTIAAAGYEATAAIYDYHTTPGDIIANIALDLDPAATGTLLLVGTLKVTFVQGGDW